jgi:hypothetical protein
MAKDGHRPIPGTDIVHVVPDMENMYHWLYLANGTVFKMNIKSGEVILAIQLPSRSEIEEKGGTKPPTVSIGQVDG